MNSAKSGVYRVGVYETDVEITHNNQEAYDLLNFLFGDMRSSGAPAAARAFDVVMAGRPTRMSLWEQEKQIYFGQCKQTLAHLLINEVIYEGIVGNHRHLALHGGAVARAGTGILLPGKSGSGKSSLTPGWSAKVLPTSPMNWYCWPGMGQSFPLPAPCH
jgi:hypothetical protein